MEGKTCAEVDFWMVVEVTEEFGPQQRNHNHSNPLHKAKSKKIYKRD